MAAKVTFDTTNKLILVTASPVNGQLSIDVRVDLYSDAKEDWLADPSLQKMQFPVRPIGGDIVSIGQLGATYILDYGWRISPNLNQKIQVGVTNNAADWAIQGVGGANEAVAQVGQMPYPGRIPDLHALVRRVGTPTDSIRLYIATSIGGTALQEAIVDGDLIPATYPSGHGQLFVFEDPPILPAATDLYLHIERTGPRDATNYYEIAVDNDVFGGTALSAWKLDSSTWTQDTAKDLVMHVHTEIPYELTIEGNIFTSDGRPVVIPTEAVSVVSQVSALVEVRETGTSGLTSAESQALLDIDTGITSLEGDVTSMYGTVSLLRKLSQNRFETDPDTGKATLYDDDGVTPIFEWNIFEDVAGTQPYRGAGVERRNAPQVP